MDGTSVNTKFYQVLDLRQLIKVDDGLFKSKMQTHWVYESKEKANAAAIDLAAKTPGTQVAVMTIDFIYESVVPKVIQKTFNEDGELVNV